MHLLELFTPLDETQLTKVEKSQGISSLVCIAEKQNGSIKVRACANGQKEREYMSKVEVADQQKCLNKFL